jgi:hypothetical protein
MSLVLCDLNSFPEPQDGEATIVLSLTVAQPEKRGDPEGWRARATCVETGRVVCRFMSDCPLSAAQLALLWLGIHPWEVLPEEGTYDYADILEQVERPASNDSIHIRDLLDRLITNLPLKPSEVRNAATGARILRRPPRALLPVAMEPEGEEEDEEDEDEEDEEEEVEADPVPVRRAVRSDRPPVAARAPVRDLKAEKAEHDRLLKRALQLVQEGRDPEELADRLERRAHAGLAETFRVASLAITASAPPPRAAMPAPAGRAPQISVEAEDEIARYAVGDESGVRAKLDRTTQRAARERARVQAHLDARARLEEARAARGEPIPAPAPAPPPAPLALSVAVVPVAEEDSTPPVKPKRPRRTKLEVVVNGESVG